MSRTEVEEIALARSMMRRRVMSIVEDQGVYNSSCGYCKSSSRTSVARGLWAHTLTVDDYQELLNRGWRRSGMFLYKPKMHRTCCPPHSIRLDVNAFTISKEQARVLRRMQRYLEGSYNGTRGSVKNGSTSSTSNGTEATPTKPRGKKSLSQDEGLEQGPPRKKKASETELDEVAQKLSASIKAAISRCIEAKSFPEDFELPQVSVRKVTENTRGKLKKATIEEGQLDYTSSIAFAIAAAMNRKRNKSKAQSSMVVVEEEVVGEEVNRPLQHHPLECSSSSPSVVAELLVSQLRDDPTGGFHIPHACKGHLNFLTVGCRLQGLGHSASSGRLDPLPGSSLSSTEGASRTQASDDTGREESELPPPSPELNAAPTPLPHIKSRHVEIQFKESSFDPEEFALYKKYQIAVHNDKPEEVKESSYLRFLVDTPLIHVAPESDGSTPSCGFGSFHQQYRIDGKLVAVGVVDILPHCLSSKYLFWDPDLAFLSLGKYSALREIQWVQEAQKMCPSLSYYYLGFYIHTCPKMRYKAAYAPSELLCPSKYIWIPYEQAKPALARAQYLCLSEPPPSQNGSTMIEPTAEERQEAEMMEESSEIDNEEEMLIDTEIIHPYYHLSSNSNGVEEPEPQVVVMENGDETIEKDKEDHSEKLGDIILLLNSKCLTFKRLEEMRVVKPEYMSVLKDGLTSYMHAVGPELASRMAFVPR